MTTNEGITVQDWVRLFEAIGLTDEQMHRWHAEFERVAPEAHRDFLESLGLGAREVARIRRWSSGGEHRRQTHARPLAC